MGKNGYKKWQNEQRGNMELKESKTKDNLRAQAFKVSLKQIEDTYILHKRLILKAANEVAQIFRSTAEGETGHAHGHLEYLEEVGDPATKVNLWVILNRI